MAILNLDYCNNEGGYSDGEIESELLQIVKESDDYNEILKKDDRWPIFYHLSPLRENVFNWYPFKKDASLLEIGSGCGALTGLFCSKVKEVKSIELTKIRGKINYERNKKHTNLELIIGNFNKIPLEEKFDYIILNGVLEYAGSFTETEDPYTDFLKKVKTFLKPNGILLIAIENRFGIKYFNGAVEDHTSRLFSGINNYAGINSVKTFTKGELSELLNDAGFNNFKYYYPVPDYKFPEVLYTDKSLDLMNFNIRNNVYNANRLSFYNEEEVQNTLTKEGIVEHFFNSFIVEVFNGERDIDNDNIIYAKFNNDRKDRFKISTKIIENDKNLKVEKSAMNYKAQRHLEWMMRYYNNQKEIGGFINTPLQKKDNAVLMPFINGETFEKILLSFLKKKEKKSFEKAILDFAHELLLEAEPKKDYFTEEFAKVFGETPYDRMLNCKKDVNIDLIFPNILIERGKGYIIDYEWVFDFWIPQEFVIWRSIYYLYLGNELIKKYYPLEELLSLVDIDQEMHGIFQNWDLFFGNTYVREDVSQRYEKLKIPVQRELNKLLKSMDLISSLYIDTGNGFNENERLDCEMMLNNHYFEVDFDLSSFAEKRIHELRWDPLESACKISNLKISEVNGKNDLELIALNSIHSDKDGEYFLINDPFYGLYGDYEGISNIRISGKIEVLDENGMFEVAGLLKKEIEHQKERSEDLFQQLETQKEATKQYTLMYEEISNSHIWKATTPIRKIIDRIK
ncbi:Methyltransferase domain-containing protein [Eubacterium maltosivorans]|uniref:class I SAM-dependent methyltransferase n=1 Tax=Eubacterium maltosivorans TaxID=2041044 RepID=UPI00089064F8|nr:class I SAM-dependent methyltransferase [Eubacterium maltosivorans]WPK79085.1 hypothetical protein EUMA32_04840 [Eubacterium maltosivorans]SDP80117.1 Methyltransferase domain-containing protein [Eubacterium maltosivorans]